MAFLPPINARAYPYDDSSAQDSNELSRGAARKRRLQVTMVDDVDYDVYYDQDSSGVAYKSTRAMDEHVLARMRDDIRRASTRQANPDSAMPDRPVEDEENLHQALQDYNTRMAQSYEEALKLPAVPPSATADARDDPSDARTPQRRQQTVQNSPVPKAPTPATRTRASNSTAAPRRSVSQSGRTHSKTRNSQTRHARSRSSPYDGTGRRTRSGRNTARSSKAASRRSSFTDHSARRNNNNSNADHHSARRPGEDEPVEYNSGDIDAFIRKEQQRSGRYADKSDVHSSIDSDSERREKLRRAHELAQRLQEETVSSSRDDWQ